MERSHDLTRRRRSGGCGSLRRAVLLSALGAAIVCAAGLLALPSQATTAVACAPDLVGALTNVSRPIAPIGVAVVRGFTVTAAARTTVSAVRLSAPAGYKAKQIPAHLAYGLRFTAPHAGTFAISAVFSVAYADASGAPQTCSASASATLNASNGTPLAAKLPPSKKFPGVKVKQWGFPDSCYGFAMCWTWKCTASSDPTPPTVTVRWEVDPREPPPFVDGKAPFRFRNPTTFTLKAGDACDRRKGAEVRRTLAQGVTLDVLIVGDIPSGGGYLGLTRRGGFRSHPKGDPNPAGNAEAFHLEVTMTQGKRTPIDTKLCAWDQTGFVLAEGTGVSCWW